MKFTATTVALLLLALCSNTTFITCHDSSDNLQSPITDSSKIAEPKEEVKLKEKEINDEKELNDEKHENLKIEKEKKKVPICKFN